MASYPTAEDEKRLLAHAAETTTVAADNQTKCQRSCRRRVASIKKVAHFTVTLAFVIACCVAFFGLSSLLIGTVRYTKPCPKHNSAAVMASGAQGGAVVVVAAGKAGGAVETAGTASGFSRLLEAVSPESLHDLLHEYFPDTYKHGVYPSEKEALEAIHRENAALATSIVQLARRDLNSSSTPPTSTPPTSTPATSSTLPTSTFKNSSTSSTATTSHTSKTSSSSTTTTGKKVTSVYTSTINGTPTVVTATSVVGVGASNTGGTSTNSGTLQTGAAVPMLGGSHNKARLAEAVAGVLVGAMLI